MEHETVAAGETSCLLEPTAGSCYGHGFHCMKKYFLELLIVIVIFLVFHIPLEGLSGFEEPRGFLEFYFGLASAAYLFLFMWPLKYGVKYTFLRAVRENNPEPKHIFYAFTNFVNAVLASLITKVIIAIGFIFLIVPGVYLACKLAFVPYLVIEEKLDAVTAMKESWRMTEGHSIQIFMIYVLAILVSFAGLLLLGVGVILSIMWIQLALASMYYAVVSIESQEKTITAAGESSMNE